MPYFVYLLASKRDGTLYLDVTRDLVRRVNEHKMKQNRGFTARYAVDRLVWYEEFEQVQDAIDREKVLKKWRRRWKIDLIEAVNSEWKDLHAGLS